MVVHGLFRPFRAWVSWGNLTQGDASLYPGLSHFAPLGLRKGGLGKGLGASLGLDFHVFGWVMLGG